MYKLSIVMCIILLSIASKVNCSVYRIIFPNRIPLNQKPMAPTTRTGQTNIGGGTCYNNGIEGTCLPIRKCPEIREFITSRGGINSPGTADILREKICSYEVQGVHLCCLNATEVVHSPILPSLDECGFSSVPKIADGEEFKHGTHPWLVALGYKKKAATIQVMCGGTLITRRHVLTAAHCFKSRNVPLLTHVILGDHSLSQQIEKEPPLILRIADRKNPGYIDSTSYNDIELVVLERDVAFTDYIRPACVPFSEHLKHFNLPQSKMTIAGWGKTSYNDAYGTDTPRHALVPMVSLSKCKEAFKEFPEVKIDDTQFCLGGKGKDTCKGDSGGPAIYEDTNMFYRHFIIGITSYGVKVCGSPVFPGVYTYVPAFTNWIVNNLQQL